MNVVIEALAARHSSCNYCRETFLFALDYASEWIPHKIRLPNKMAVAHCTLWHHTVMDYAFVFFSPVKHYKAIDQRQLLIKQQFSVMEYIISSLDWLLLGVWCKFVVSMHWAVTSSISI